MLLDKLRTIQETKKLTDKDMSEMLGISRQAWQLYRTDPDTLPKPKIYTGILRTYPELETDVIKYLKDGGKE